MQASLIVAAGGSSARFKRSLSAGPQWQRESGLGAGRRSHRTLSKLFFLLQGMPLLAYPLSSFQKISGINETIVAVPPNALNQVRKLIQDFGWKGVKLVHGGQTRAESVWNALRRSKSSNDWVLVHDGARPFVSPGIVRKLFQVATKVDGVILAKKVVSTVKEVDKMGNIRRTLNREPLYEAETPQLVRRSLLEKAYRENPNAMNATDEAFLLESMDAKLKVVTHESWNPKITTLQDLELAESFLLKEGKVEIRTGFGRDSHRLVTGRKLYVGGIRIPYARGALGHSDGDALLHAVTDAILGAIGAGDIGDWFPDHKAKFKNIRSRKILSAVLQEVKKKGWKVQHLDTVVNLERPKLGLLKGKIRENLARLIELPVDAVSVKAKTMEGLGFGGGGDAISCEAITTVKRCLL